MAKLPMPANDPYTYSDHSGMDFQRGPKNAGKPILASGPGKVLRKPHNAKGGWWTTIQYDNGAVIGYAHQNSQASIAIGTRVKEGTVIGHVGNKGTNVKGYHVHVENINNPTQAGFWAVFDSTRVVGSGGGSTTPPVTPPTEGDKEFMDKLNEIWQAWLPGKAGVKTAGDAYLLFIEMVNNVRNVGNTVWSRTVTRDGKAVSASQELYDAKTLGIKANEKLDALVARPTNSVTLTDAQIEAIGAKVADAVALKLAPGILDLMAERLKS